MHAEIKAKDVASILLPVFEAVDDAESYTIELQDASEMAQQIFSQNFVNFNADITNAGYDFAAQGVLDTYLTGGKGWTCEKVFTGQDFYSSTWMLKLGSSTATGSITTPTIKNSSSFDGKSYNLIGISASASTTGIHIHNGIKYVNRQ